MNWKLLSILLLNVHGIFAAIYHIKNDSSVKLFIVDPNSGYAITLEPDRIGQIDSTLKGLKKIFFNETLNFFEEEKPSSETFKLKYQLRDNDLTRKSIDLTYNQVKDFAGKSNSDLVITSFK